MDINSLERFVEAQERTYQVALSEVYNGNKRTHWMWYIFPQLRGLGRSSMAHIYGISGLEEAKAYLEHPILSERLYEICGALLEHKGANIVEIFGDIDTLKLRSSMTLFSLTSEEYTIFDEVLDTFFEGQMDEATLKRLS